MTAPSAATDRLDEDELADWRSGRDAIYQLAAVRIVARFFIEGLADALDHAAMDLPSSEQRVDAHTRIIDRDIIEDLHDSRIPAVCPARSVAIDTWQPQVGPSKGCPSGSDSAMG